MLPFILKVRVIPSAIFCCTGASTWTPLRLTFERCLLVLTQISARNFGLTAPPEQRAELRDNRGCCRCKGRAVRADGGAALGRGPRGTQGRAAAGQQQDSVPLGGVGPAPLPGGGRGLSALPSARTRCPQSPRRERLRDALTARFPLKQPQGPEREKNLWPPSPGPAARRRRSGYAPRPPAAGTASRHGGNPPGTPRSSRGSRPQSFPRPQRGTAVRIVSGRGSGRGAGVRGIPALPRASWAGPRRAAGGGRYLPGSTSSRAPSGSSPPRSCGSCRCRRRT